MKINIGSKSIPKIKAVKEIAEMYDMLKNAEIKSFPVDSGVSGQPKGFDEIITGAKNRARNAFKDCNLSFGLESGLVKVPHTKTGYLDFGCCAIFDGTEFHIGMSCGVEFPKKVIKHIEENNSNLSEAFKELKLTEHDYIGNTPEGGIGFLTKNRITRIGYTKQSIITAMVHLENKELY